MLTKDGKYLDSTLEALEECFPQLDMKEVKNYITNNPTSSYYVPLKKMSYSEISDFMEIQNDTQKDEDGNPGRGNDIKGVWFEESYKEAIPTAALPVMSSALPHRTASACTVWKSITTIC